MKSKGKYYFVSNRCYKTEVDRLYRFDGRFYFEMKQEDRFQELIKNKYGQSLVTDLYKDKTLWKWNMKVVGYFRKYSFEPDSNQQPKDINYAGF